MTEEKAERRGFKLAMRALALAYLHTERTRTPEELRTAQSPERHLAAPRNAEMMDVFHRLGCAIVAAERFAESREFAAEDWMRQLARELQDAGRADRADAVAANLAARREALADRYVLGDLLRADDW
ncbi:MAG TPA: hypothetical protein VFB99_12875 [Vicinamibacterales bacterium]|nr:hypothetical protein [Vicinamibacterales bacterium]